MKTLDLKNYSLDSAAKIAADVLRGGGLVVYPTETVYGLAADATNPAAIAKLLRYKTKRDDKPLSIAVNGLAMADEYVVRNRTAQEAYKRFLPGPVTVVSQDRGRLAPGVASMLGTVGVRWSSHPLVAAIVTQLGRPITATSANASQQKRPYTLTDILNHTSPRQQGLLDLFLDAGTLPPAEPSTVLDTTSDELFVLRAGSLALREEDTLTSHTVDDTLAWGKTIARRYASKYGRVPVVFALSGEMGVGKTHFTKGIAQGLGITDTVISPSYNLLLEYSFVAEGRTLPLLHIDAWRLTAVDELLALGLDPLWQAPGVLVLEWANFMPDWLASLPADTVVIGINFAYGNGENERLITLGRFQPGPSSPGDQPHQDERGRQESA